VEWQPLDWLQFLAEYDANSVNLGAKLFTPQQWSPAGWQAYTSVQAYQQENHTERDYWFGVGVKVPLWLGYILSFDILVQVYFLDFKWIRIL
jgi:hypothetical protein